jgi:hypothetical protein
VSSNWLSWAMKWVPHRDHIVRVHGYECMCTSSRGAGVAISFWCWRACGEVMFLPVTSFVLAEPELNAAVPAMLCSPGSCQVYNCTPLWLTCRGWSTGMHGLSLKPAHIECVHCEMHQWTTIQGICCASLAFIWADAIWCVQLDARLPVCAAGLHYAYNASLSGYQHNSGYLQPYAGQWLLACMTHPMQGSCTGHQGFAGCDLLHQMATFGTSLHILQGYRSVWQVHAHL